MSAELLAIAAALTTAAAALVRLSAASARDPDELLPLAAAAAEAHCSVRALSDARRSGALATYGTQRTRTVRRRDLAAWIESRRAPVYPGAANADMDRRMRNLKRARSGSKRR